MRDRLPYLIRPPRRPMMFIHPRTRIFGGRRSNILYFILIVFVLTFFISLLMITFFLF